MSQISIILPTYNPDMYKLTRVVQSILEQSYADFEIIIIDDGSDIEKKKKIDDLSLRDNRIQIIHQENTGVSNARNNGIKAASGQYVSFVDDDDFLQPDFLKEAYEIIVHSDCDYVVGMTKHCEDDAIQKILVSQGKLDYRDVRVLENEEIKKFAKKHLINTSDLIRTKDGYIGRGPVCRLVKKEVMINTFFPDSIKYHEDLIWNQNILSKCKRIALVYRIWYYYIRNYNSATYRFNSDALSDYGISIRLVIDAIEYNTQTDLRQICSFEHDCLKYLSNIYFCNPENKANSIEKSCQMRRLSKTYPWTILSHDVFRFGKQISPKLRMIGFLFRTGLLYYYWMMKKR